MTTSALERLAHRCHIVETGDESIRFLRSTEQTMRRIKSCERARKAANSPTTTEVE